MKYLPIITVLLWVSIIAGYIFARDFILQPFIKFPSIIVLSIFLPVCLWGLASQGRRFYSFVFIAIFTLNSATLIYAVFRDYTFLNTLEPYKEMYIDPEVAKLLVIGESEEMRRVTSQKIFKKHGVSLPYLAAAKNYITNDESYRIYSPTNSDEYTFHKNRVKDLRTLLAKDNTKIQINYLLFLLAMHGVIFFGLLFFLILYEGANRQES